MPISPRALQRRARSYLRRNQLDFYMQVQPGFEQIAADELAALGYSPKVGRGGVSFRGELSSIYEVNLSHRTGSRLLLRVAEFLAQNYPMLYHHTVRLPWETFLGNCPAVKVRATFRNSRLRNKAHIEDVVGDAIGARLEGYGLAPAMHKQPAVTIHARIFRDRCTISLDTTGSHLHKRGYRPEAADAPLRETTAAGVLLAANGPDFDVVLDPFCGSGTIPIEADLLARNRAPGLAREFAIQCSPLHAQGTFAAMRRRVEDRCANPNGTRILGFDINRASIELAHRCATRAGTSNVSFELAAAQTIDYGRFLSGNERGLIATNVPYGVRVGTIDAAHELSRLFAEQLQASAKGWHFAIIAPCKTPLASTLPVARILEFANGGIRVCALLGRIPI